jgi:hypothetical protein
VVIEGLTHLEPAEVSAPASQPVDLSPQLLKPRVERLRQRLAASDPAALDLVAELATLFADHPGQRKAVQRISDKVNDFEFDEALGLLDEWSGGLQLSS